VLESQVRMQIVAEGYDPKIGFLHTSDPNRPALAQLIAIRSVTHVPSGGFHDTVGWGV
jgi:hypothetical protein